MKSFLKIMKNILGNEIDAVPRDGNGPARRENG
jgi:hypothetical protein